MDPGIDNIPQNQINMYLQNAAAHKPGITRHEVNEYYNKWSSKYEQDLNEKIYRGPKIAADLCEIFLSDKNAKILDVGCGTGLIGEYLARMGFKLIDGLEPSENMAALAKTKNVYQQIYTEGISTDKETSIQSDSYDACVMSGAFGEGHIPSDGLLEILRLVKPSGYIINVMRKEYLSYVKDYVDRFGVVIERLRDEGRWTLAAKFDVENYSFNKTGSIFVFKKN